MVQSPCQNASPLCQPPFYQLQQQNTSHWNIDISEIINRYKHFAQKAVILVNASRLHQFFAKERCISGPKLPLKQHQANNCKMDQLPTCINNFFIRLCKVLLRAGSYNRELGDRNHLEEMKIIIKYVITTNTGIQLYKTALLYAVKSSYMFFNLRPSLLNVQFVWSQFHYVTVKLLLCITCV